MSLRAEIRWKMDSRGMERPRSLLAYSSSSSPPSDETEDCCMESRWSGKSASMLQASQSRAAYTHSIALVLPVILVILRSGSLPPDALVLDLLELDHCLSLLLRS